MKLDTDAPEVGSVCPAMINEDYTYHLSGDCSNYCICSITGRYCLGMMAEDVDNQSSQFFSRARNILNRDGLASCPCYGVSKQTLVTIITEKAERELKAKLDNLSKESAS